VVRDADVHLACVAVHIRRSVCAGVRFEPEHIAHEFNVSVLFVHDVLTSVYDVLMRRGYFSAARPISHVVNELPDQGQLKISSCLRSAGLLRWLCDITWAEAHYKFRLVHACEAQGDSPPIRWVFDAYVFEQRHMGAVLRAEGVLGIIPQVKRSCRHLRSHVGVPRIHQSAALLQRIKPPVGAFRVVADDVSKRHLHHLAGELCHLAGPIPEG
jgi:hypothetical protein